MHFLLFSSSSRRFPRRGNFSPFWLILRLLRPIFTFLFSMSFSDCFSPLWRCDAFRLSFSLPKSDRLVRSLAFTSVQFSRSVNVPSGNFTQ